LDCDIRGRSVLAAYEPRYTATIRDESAICLKIMQPVLRVRAAFRKHSEGSSVSETDFRSDHTSSLSLSFSRVVLPNPPAGYHVIFVAQCGTLEAQPSRSSNPYAKAPMVHCRLGGACSGCDARLLLLRTSQSPCRTKTRHYFLHTANNAKPCG
jgi:hypothetical protein